MTEIIICIYENNNNIFEHFQNDQSLKILKLF